MEGDKGQRKESTVFHHSLCEVWVLLGCSGSDFLSLHGEPTNPKLLEKNFNMQPSGYEDPGPSHFGSDLGEFQHSHLRAQDSYWATVEIKTKH